MPFIYFLMSNKIGVLKSYIRFEDYLTISYTDKVYKLVLLFVGKIVVWFICWVSRQGFAIEELVLFDSREVRALESSRNVCLLIFQEIFLRIKLSMSILITYNLNSYKNRIFLQGGDGTLDR